MFSATKRNPASVGSGECLGRDEAPLHTVQLVVDPHSSKPRAVAAALKWYLAFRGAGGCDGVIVVIYTISVSLVALGVSRSVQSTRCGHSHFTPRSHAPPASFALRRGRRVGSALNSLTRSRRTFSRTFIFVVPNSWPSPEEDRRPRLASHRKQRRQGDHRTPAQCRC